MVYYTSSSTDRDGRIVVEVKNRLVLGTLRSTSSFSKWSSSDVWQHQVIAPANTLYIFVTHGASPNSTVMPLVCG